MNSTGPGERGTALPRALDKQFEGGHRAPVFQNSEHARPPEQGLIERQKYAILTGAMTDRAEAVDQFEKAVFSSR